MEVGLRVVRGPDWKLNDTESDGGEGFVGTVVEVGGKSCSLPENLVWVQWDSGIRHDHRAGYYGAFDLCVLDSTPIGIKHDGIECRSCKQNPILGMCWKCQDCGSNFNLCTSCYMADEHEKQHAFLRLDFPDQDGVSVGRRAGAKKIQSRGIFPGAKVVRGIDWIWKNQDGGEGKEGVVMELKNWKTSPKRGVLVSWDCAKKQTYRLGAKGKVDLKCAKPGTGGFYYKDHLPKMGEWTCKLKRKKTGREDAATGSCTSEKADDNKPAVGDTVCVSLPSDIVQAMNSDIETWTDENDRYLGKVGTLHSVTSSGGVSILYSDKKILTFHPDLVTKVDKQTNDGAAGLSTKFTKGASVKITENEESLRELQQGHGPCNESVLQARGKEGKVLDVTPAGDVEVIVGENCAATVIVFNAAALSLVEDGNSPHPGRAAVNHSDKIEYKADVGSSRLLQGDGRLGLFLCQAAAAGDVSVVENVLDNQPHLVNYSDDGTHPPLFRACQQGHPDVATVLLSRGADINYKDSQSYTALHHAANSDMSGATARVLVDLGATLNDIQNDGSSSPLHLATKVINLETIQVLIQAGCNINLLDGQGFTALHYSAHGDTTGATARLLTENGADLNNNHNGGRLSPLLLAAREFNPNVAEILLQAGCDANLQDHEGLTALHIAARSDISGTIAGILVAGGADVNSNTNNALLAPLHIAVVEHNVEAVGVLVRAGCNVNLQHLDGSTALHNAARRGDLQMAETLLNVPSLDLTIRNKEGLTSFLLAIINQFKEIAKKIFEKSSDVASIPGQGGMTTLHFAALYDDLKLLQDLLDSGKVSVDSRNKDGLTPLDLATAAGRSSVVEVLRKRTEDSTASTTGLSAGNGQPIMNIPSKKEEVPCALNMETYNFRFGDTAQVRENWRVVEPLQHGHGGWNHTMMKLLGRTGFVEEILDSGDVRLSVQEYGQTFAIPFVFNPLALIPILSEDNGTSTVAPVEQSMRSLDNLAPESVTDEVVEMDPILNYALMSDSFLDLIRIDPDELGDVNHVNARRMLFIACKMRWLAKVQEIISKYPEAVNQKEGDKFGLHVFCFYADFEVVMMLLEAGADVAVRDHNNFTPLHAAAMGDKSGLVTDLLLKKGADPSDNDNKLCVTPLHLAVVRNSEGAAKNLAARSGTYINLQNLEGDSPLHSATDLGREEMVAMMLTVEEIDPGLFNRRGYLPIHLAAEEGYERIVRMLVDHSKLRVNTVTCNAAPMSPIELAYNNGHMDVAKVIVKTNECDFRITSGEGHTTKEHEELVAFISDYLEQLTRENIKQQHLEKYANKPLNEESNLKEGNQGSLEEANAESPSPTEGRSGDAVREPESQTELILQKDMQGLILDDIESGVLIKGGDGGMKHVKDKKLDHCQLYDEKSKKKPRVMGGIRETQEIPKDRIDKVLKAVLAADVKKFVAILESWPQVVNRLFSGTTLLHLASCDGFLRVLTKLIEFGANIMAKDGNGLTPLQIAAARERTGTATRVLLDSGADPNFQSSEAKNRTALHIAVLCNNIVVVEELIERKCNINVKDDRGNTPMHDAIDQDKDDIATLILETPTYDSLSRNDKGLNTLHKATLKGKKLLLKRLLVRSPNIVNEATPEGDTAIHLAAANGSPEIAKILIEEGHCRLEVWNNNNETPCKVALSSGHNELARLLWGEHDSVEVYEQLFSQMAQTDQEELTEELEQTGPELELSDSETSSVEGTTEPLDMQNLDISLERRTTGDGVPSQLASTNLGEEGEQNDFEARPQAPSQISKEENKQEERGEGPKSSGTDEIPDRLLCCICLDKQKNIAFQCGHMNTCAECAKKITECPECKAVIKSRLTTYY